jgi:hypothetical protein
MVEKNEVKQSGKTLNLLGDEESLFHATDTRDKNLGTMLLNQTVGCIWEPTDKTGGANQAVAMIRTMEGISPRDVIEGMLTAQMLAVYNASMECMRRAMIPEQSFDGRKDNLNQATKLTRTFTT